MRERKEDYLARRRGGKELEEIEEGKLQSWYIVWENNLFLLKE